MLMKFEVALDTDEATVAEVLDGIERALAVLKLSNGDTLYTEVCDLSVAFLVDVVPNAEIKGQAGV